MRNIALVIFAFVALCASKNSLAQSVEKSPLLQDSLIAKDFILHQTSPEIESVTATKNKRKGNNLYIKLGYKTFADANNNSTSLGIAGKSKSRESRSVTAPAFDKVEILSGNYEEMKADKLSTTQNLFTLKNSEFPIRLKMYIGKEYIDFEVKEQGEWNIEVQYKK